MAKRRQRSLRASEDDDPAHTGGITGGIILAEETHEESVLPAIPQPEEMSKYEEIHPGFAERVLAMAERQQQESIESRKQFDRNSYRIVSRHQWLLGGICVLGLLVVAFGFYQGLGWPSFGIFSSFALLIAALNFIHKR